MCLSPLWQQARLCPCQAWRTRVFPVCAEPDGVEHLEAICRSQEHSRCKTLVGILLARYPRKALLCCLLGASLLPSSSSLSFPSPPLTHRAMEGVATYVCFTDEEWALWEWADPFFPSVWRLMGKELAKFLYIKVQKKNWSLLGSWEEERKSCSFVDKGGVYINTFRMVLQRLPIYALSLFKIHLWRIEIFLLEFLI